MLGSAASYRSALLPVAAAVAEAPDDAAHRSIARAGLDDERAGIRRSFLPPCNTAAVNTPTMPHRKDPDVSAGESKSRWPWFPLVFGLVLWVLLALVLFFEGYGFPWLMLIFFVFAVPAAVRFGLHNRRTR